MQSRIATMNHFNPRSPCGERRYEVRKAHLYGHFNPRSPCGERRKECGHYDASAKFQSTLPVRGATKKSEGFRRIEQISIHAPRAGSDRAERNAVDALSNFNPRSPCGERQGCVRIRIWSQRFQSTLPVRGATAFIRSIHTRLNDFNPRSPCGERL